MELAIIIIGAIGAITSGIIGGVSAKKQREAVDVSEQRAMGQAAQSRRDVLRQQAFANTIGARQQAESERATRTAGRQGNMQLALNRQQLSEQSRQFDVGAQQAAEVFDFGKAKWGEEFSHQKEMDKESLALKRQEIRRSNLSTLSQNLLQATATDMSFRNYMSNLYGGRRAA